MSLIYGELRESFETVRNCETRLWFGKGKEVGNPVATIFHCFIPLRKEL